MMGDYWQPLLAAMIGVGLGMIIHAGMIIHDWFLARSKREDVRADRIARDAEVARRIRGVNATPGSINSGYDKSHSIKDDPEHRRGGCCEAHSPGSTEWKAQQRTTEDGEQP